MVRACGTRRAMQSDGKSRRAAGRNLSQRRRMRRETCGISARECREVPPAYGSVLLTSIIIVAQSVILKRMSRLGFAHIYFLCALDGLNRYIYNIQTRCTSSSLQLLADSQNELIHQTDSLPISQQARKCSALDEDTCWLAVDFRYVVVMLCDSGERYLSVNGLFKSQLRPQDNYK